MGLCNVPGNSGESEIIRKTFVKERKMRKDILYPLRRLHGKFHEWRLECRENAEYKRYLLSSSRKKCYLLGTPAHTNMGDSAIVLAEVAYIKQFGIDVKEITTKEWKRFQKVITKAIRKADMIFWHGGGNMGDQWFYEELVRREAMAAFPLNPLMIFPQTIHYSNTEEGCREAEKGKCFYDGRENLIIVARERKSAEIMERLYPNTKILLTPDIVLSATKETFGLCDQDRSGVLLCMRSDLERAMTDEMRKAVEYLLEKEGASFRYMDMYSNKPVDKQNRLEAVREKMEELASAELVITDRLHGMVFCALTGTPCIVFGNYNHKVYGTYEWIQHLPYVRYVETVEDVAELLPMMLRMGRQTYDNDPLMPHFEKLAQVVRDYAEN